MNMHYATIERSRKYRTFPAMKMAVPSSCHFDAISFIGEERLMKEMNIERADGMDESKDDRITISIPVLRLDHKQRLAFSL